MGIFGFLSEVTEATVKIAVTPIAITKDVVDVTLGLEPELTEKVLKSAKKDLEDSIDELIGEK